VLLLLLLLLLLSVCVVAARIESTISWMNSDSKLENDMKDNR
jgi:hypothetical protein